MNAIFYVKRGGISRRLLPSDFRQEAQYTVAAVILVRRIARLS
jgi:hypothetical protein